MTFRSVTYGRYEVGGGGGHSGPGGGRGVPERFGEEGPHHSIAGKEQPATQQPQRNMELKRHIRNTHIYHLTGVDKLWSGGYMRPVNLAGQT